MPVELWIEELVPERRFSFRWHPFAIEQGVDYSSEPTTLIVFTLEAVPDGVSLTLTESGFDHIPLARRAVPSAPTRAAGAWCSGSSTDTSRVRRSGKPNAALKASASLFAALGDETRLKLVMALREQGPSSIARLTEGSNLTRQAITKHLGVMEDGPRRKPASGSGERVATRAEARG